MAHNRICPVEGCGKPQRTKGYCGAHYARFQRHGDPLGGRTSQGYPQRFYTETVLTYAGEDCLLWPYSRTPKGYGKMKRDGKLELVHRLVCEDVNGPPPTPEHQSAHLCGRGHEGCCHPGHLVWKTPLQNKADELVHGTRNRGGRQGHAKITEDKAREIIALRGKEKRSAIAERYGITPSAVSLIQLGKRWSWLD